MTQGLNKLSQHQSISIGIFNRGDINNCNLIASRVRALAPS